MYPTIERDVSGYSIFNVGGDRVIVYNKGANAKLSDNFRSGEFDDCWENESNHFTLISPFLMVAMQQIRGTIDKPVTITSGFRTTNKNIDIGGAKSSYHTKGMAADWTADINLEEFYNLLIDPKYNRFPFIKGVGYYPNRHFIHIDVRNVDKRVTWIGD